MKFRKFFAWGISGALFLVASLLIISRLTFRVLDKCEEMLSCSNVQCDDAIFSALAHDDNFGRRILLQSGEWVKFKAVPRMRRLWKSLRGDGYFYATASDGRRIKKRCFNFNLDLATELVALEIQKGLVPETVVDDVFDDSCIARILLVDMKNNCDDFRIATSSVRPNEAAERKEVHEIKPEDLMLGR